MTLQQTVPSASCLSDDELASFVADELASARRGQLASHVDHCERCRRLLSALAGAEHAEHAAESAPGGRLGRFTVVRLLGHGSMGEVWAAHDPVLDREVALKLMRVRSDALGSEPAAYILREAQAMARLNHPNVVAIYELGTDGDRVFCAMELVDGTTLRAWLAEPRTWRAVLEVALAVGRGVAAAHDAGLVHRDIKPDNVMMARDGRTLVTDFGLAKLSDLGRHPRIEPPLEASGALATDETVRAHDLTRTGALVGTPAYMPPEQLEGRAVDARSDQFSYCVTIYEALFGARPFAGGSVDELAAAIRRGRDKPAARRGVPAGVARVLARGLAADPKARWPSMPALLHQLARAAARPRRVWIALAAGAAVIAGTAAIIALPRPGDPRAEMAAAAEGQIARAWGPEKRLMLTTRFLTTRAPGADVHAANVARALDSYSADWLQRRTDAWAATHVRNEQPPALLERRLACFDRLADALGDLVSLFATAATAEVARAPQTVFQLEPPQSCAQVERLLAAPAAPSTPAGQSAERELRELEVLQLAGRRDEALKRAAALLDRATVLGDPALLARARYNLGAAQVMNGQLEPAVATLRRAVQEAAFAREHFLVADAWIRLHNTIGFDLHQSTSEIEPALRAAVAQAGNDPRQAADLAMTLGVVVNARGDYAAARDHFAVALERRIAARGPDHPVVANDESNLGTALMLLGEFDEATRRLERAIAIIRAAIGEQHPVVSRAHQSLASIAHRRKDWRGAETHLRAAIAIMAVVRGPDHPDTARQRALLSRALRNQRRFADARHELALARTALDRALPPTHDHRILLDLYLGQIAEAEGNYPVAERIVRQAVSDLKAARASAVSVSFALAELARIVAHRSARDALPVYAEALERHLAQPSRDESGDIETLAELGEVALRAGDPAAALVWFDRMPKAAAKLTELRGKLEAARRKRRH